MKARSPAKFMDVSYVKLTDEDGFLSRSMMINAKNIIMKERIWIHRGTAARCHNGIEVESRGAQPECVIRNLFVWSESLCNS